MIAGANYFWGDSARWERLAPPGRLMPSGAGRCLVIGYPEIDSSRSLQTEYSQMVRTSMNILNVPLLLSIPHFTI